MHCYQYIILFLQPTLWTAFMGYTCKSSFKITEKTVRIMSNSEYLAHSQPLFKTLKLLKIEDLYKLKLSFTITCHITYYHHISIITWK